MRQLEVCVDTFSAAKAAEVCGADRLELCADLSTGGLTPEPGLLERVLTEVNIGVQVMIRPRSGGFIYTDDELRTMAASVVFIRKRWPKIRGFVTGAILPEGIIHRDAMMRLLAATEEYPVTFHRAFDRTRDLSEALETCVELGMERILTSGGADGVDQGMEGLATLQRQSAGRINILPGGGVRADNAQTILERTGVTELHLSGRRSVPMGPRDDDRAYELDPAAIKTVREILNFYKL